MTDTPPPSGHYRLRRFDHDEARRLYAAGWSMQSIANKLGVTRAAVARIMHQTYEGNSIDILVANLTANIGRIDHEISIYEKRIEELQAEREPFIRAIAAAKSTP